MIARVKAVEISGCYPQVANEFCITSAERFPMRVPKKCSKPALFLFIVCIREFLLKLFVKQTLNFSQKTIRPFARVFQILRPSACKCFSLVEQVFAHSVESTVGYGVVVFFHKFPQHNRVGQQQENVCAYPRDGVGKANSDVTP